jgi:hypothetical protein
MSKSLQIAFSQSLFDTCVNAELQAHLTYHLFRFSRCPRGARGERRPRQCKPTRGAAAQGDYGRDGGKGYGWGRGGTDLRRVGPHVISRLLHFALALSRFPACFARLSSAMCAPHLRYGISFEGILALSPGSLGESQGTLQWWKGADLAEAGASSGSLCSGHASLFQSSLSVGFSQGTSMQNPPNEATSIALPSVVRRRSFLVVYLETMAHPAGFRLDSRLLRRGRSSACVCGGLQ